MLDQELKTQLAQVFAGLEKTVELKVYQTQHEGAAALSAMLLDLQDVSSKIKISNLSQSATVPTFSVWVEGRDTGVSFRGMPGGHEFSSLVLAILNASGLGKLPDAGLISRIARLKPGLVLRTYISLSCENCPDVVQALNQICMLHPDMRHTMIDGGLVQDELTALGIQGVPSVYVGDQLLHSGRANLAELLSKLEALGSALPSQQPLQHGEFDVAVIGGGPAGVSAAIYSARKGLKTALLAERIGGQVQETKGIENLISVPYTEGPQLSAELDKHLKVYPITILEHRRVQKIEDGALKTLHLAGAEQVQARSVIIATGARWRELGVPGEKEYIGRGVAFCPHCDGPYYKNKAVAVVGGGNSGVEAAIDLSGICSQVILLEFQDELKADAVLVQKLKTLSNVKIITQAKTEKILGDGQKVYAMRYVDRVSGTSHELPLDGVFVQIGLSPNSASFKDLLQTNRHGEIIVDQHGRTSVSGIYAAGDVTTTPYKQIVIAMGEGAKVALSAFEDRMRA